MLCAHRDGVVVVALGTRFLHPLPFFWREFCAGNLLHPNAVLKINYVGHSHAKTAVMNVTTFQGFDIDPTVVGRTSADLHNDIDDPVRLEV